MGTTIEGIIVPVVTPFNEHEEVDEHSLLRILDFLLAARVHGLFPIGSQGEFFALDASEKTELIEKVVDYTAGRAFVMPNTGCISTRETIKLSRAAEAAGVDAISVITPFYIKPSQDELCGHYRRIAEAVKIPVLMYNNPGRTGTNLLPETVAKLSRELPNLVGIKDSSGDLSQTTEYVRLCRSGFKTFMGRDTLIYAGLMSGCVGAVAATANVVPELVMNIYRAVKAKNYEQARELQAQLAPLRRAFTLGSFPVVVKEAMQMMGLSAGPARGPISGLAPERRHELESILCTLGVIAANRHQ